MLIKQYHISKTKNKKRLKRQRDSFSKKVFDFQFFIYKYFYKFLLKILEFINSFIKIVSLSLCLF